MLQRVVVPETLDGLAANDPAAMRSRRDLRRVHRAMRTPSIMLTALKDMTLWRHQVTPLRVLELGAGDGSLMLGVAPSLVRKWPQVELTLLDAQALVEPATIRRYAELGWTATTEVADVLDWAAAPSDPLLPGGGAARWDVIVANLFLHHFEGAQLDAVLRAVAARTDRFFACEPRRAWLALAGSHLVGAIGANAVTREDAVLSVHAGWRGNELSALWPARGEEWQLEEYSAGLFSHCFRAQRYELA
jgi:hypothetical protein